MDWDCRQMDWLILEDFLMEYRNAKRVNDTVIDCEINHPQHGWIPFTCDPNDTGALFDVAELHARLHADPLTEAYVPLTYAQLNERVAIEIRAHRKKLLVASDWTQVADAPVDQAAWAIYRQALRDITEQVGFPETINWPVAL